MNLTPLDPSADTRKLQDAVLARMGPEGRLRVAFELSEVLRQLRLAGIRSECPGLPEAEVVRRFVLEVHGVRLEASV